MNNYYPKNIKIAVKKIVIEWIKEMVQDVF